MRNFLLFGLIFFVAHVYAQESSYSVGYKEKGKASFYDKDLHKKTLASGEEYDMFGMTAAHPSIPFNSIIKVTNLSNQKWVTLRVNDRGPFTKSRILDISKRAALKLDMVADGVVDIELEILKVGDNKIMTEAGEVSGDANKPQAAGGPRKEKTKEKPKPVASQTPAAPPAKAQKGNAQKGKAEKNSAPKGKEQKTKPTVAQSKAAGSGNAAAKGQADKGKSNAATKPGNVNKGVPLFKRFEETGTYNVWGTKVALSGYGLQLASYSDIKIAHKVAKEAQNLGLEEVYIQSGWTNGEHAYRIIYGSEEDKEALNPLVEKAEKKGFMGVFPRKLF